MPGGLPVGSNVALTVTKTRPGNTTAYAAGDVISESTSTGTAWVFSNAAKVKGGSGTIIRAALLDDDTAHTWSGVLLLFRVTPTGNLDDNGANTEPLSGTDDDFIGALAFDTLVDQGTGYSYATATPGNSKLPLPFVCANGDATIYGVLTTDAFTPTSAEVFRIILQIVQD
jgi:hypothetical protein